ncbi:MAG: radical SAM protein [Pseudomonadota bacterium]
MLQGTPFCNLNCSYCDLSATSRKRRVEMPLELLEHTFREVFSSDHICSDLSIVWHSGEPLTLSPNYYQDAIDIISRLRDELAPGRVALSFDFQTNGLLISEEWVRFFDRNRHQLHLGVSVDGPAEIHDAFRLNWGGKPTFSKVERGMTLLKEAGIPFKIISVVTDATLRQPDLYFDFILDWYRSLSGFHFNILADGSLADQPGLTYDRADRDRYYTFYRHLLSRARAAEAQFQGFSVQNFGQALSRILARESDPVSHSSLPLRSLNVDVEGYVTTFYAGLERGTFADLYGDGDGLALGNIRTTSLRDMVASPKLQQMMLDFSRSHAACHQNCDYYALCSGGFELAQYKAHNHFEGGETAECAIIVKTLIDAVLDDVADVSDRHRKAS